MGWHEMNGSHFSATFTRHTFSLFEHGQDERKRKGEAQISFTSLFICVKESDLYGTLRVT